MPTSTLTLKQPSDLLVAIPYVLGFSPQDSLVVAVLQDSRLILTERITLPADHTEVAAVVEELGHHAVINGGDRAIVIGYDNDDRVAAVAVEAMTGWLRQHDVAVMDAYLVRGDRFWTADCPDVSCCPPEGRPIPDQAGAAHLTAEFIGHGLAPRDSRQALAELVEPGPGAEDVQRILDGVSGIDPENMDADEAEDQLERHQAWRRILALTDRGPIAPVDAALAAVTLRDVATRDGLVAWLTPGMLPRDQFGPPVTDLLEALDVDWEACGAPHSSSNMLQVQDRLVSLCAALPETVAAPALCLLATHAWWAGNGALAGIATERALRCDPDYRLARLLHLTLSMGIPATR